MSTLRFVCVIIPLVLLAPPSALAAASGPGAAPSATQQPAAPTLHVYSREADVNVIVTDATGHPVYGLQPSDFSIAEDGKPQSITNFSESGSPAAPAPVPRLLSPSQRRLPPGVYTNYAATPAAGPVNIILIDALNSAPVLVSYAEQQINDYFRTMPQGTMVAVFWLSGSGLHMLQDFTSDRELLLKATSSNREDFAIDDWQWTRRWIATDGLKEIGEYVAGIKGRKNLIWFTADPVHLLHDGGYSWKNTPDTATVHRLMDVYELYTAEQIAVSPVDPHGVHRLGPVQLRMQAIADDTGGIAYYNNNDLALAISKAVQDGSHFYTLTYLPPTHSNDGHFHRITVHVDRPGLKLVYRSGYDAKEVNASTPAGPALMDASLQGKVPAASQILFDARVVPLPPGSVPPAKPTSGKPHPTTPYDVLFAVPQRQVAFSDGPNGTHHAILQFGLTAYDIDGKLMDRYIQNVTLNLTHSEYAQFLTKPLQFHERFSLPAGQYSVHLGVLDETSNNVGSLEISVSNWLTPGQAAASRFILNHRSANPQ